MDVTCTRSDRKAGTRHLVARRRLAAVILLVAALVTAPGAAQQARYTELDMSSLASVRYLQPNPLEVKAKRNKPAELPAWLKALNGKPVTMRGYMLPYESGPSTVTEFMLVANAMGCCFGAPTSVTEWVSITMKGNGRAYMSQDAIDVRGTLFVGEEFDQAGYIMSLFRIVADSVDGEPSRR
jgi:hypothetical protein